MRQGSRLENLSSRTGTPWLIAIRYREPIPSPPPPRPASCSVCVFHWSYAAAWFLFIVVLLLFFSGDALDVCPGLGSRVGHDLLDVQLQGAHEPRWLAVRGHVRAVYAVCAHHHHGRLLLLLRDQVWKPCVYGCVPWLSCCVCAFATTSGALCSKACVPFYSHCRSSCVYSSLVAPDLRHPACWKASR